ncbi:hypothetical protein THASP1DRAFT_12799 [Thamnocephalis sphaerospora]|uniref:threonine--tRNA ligase n=1 Tax=Thamnocephalis sphaerospora TaxID=78915 RepID=A0A4P9XYG7_9FUNG|nr:hypothetical protein THASP1DRAFT_12799 [Thamnocephalis sphaerospora]|eukprot:RKP10470.1 hypothetical protein THASP1DRAFT_12799 [Thamnocephalis sphaerospora]
MQQPLPAGRDSSDIALAFVDAEDPHAAPVFAATAAQVLGQAAARVHTGTVLGCHGGATEENAFFYEYIALARHLDEATCAQLHHALLSAGGDREAAAAALVALLDAVGVQHTSEHDLSRIMTEFNKIVESNLALERLDTSLDAAQQMLARDPLKAYRVQQRSSDATMALYRCGDSVDLAQGPLLPSTGLLRHTELTSTAAAHWWALPDKAGVPQHVTHLSGVSFATAEQRKNWRTRIANARHRDHRVIGAKQGLFSFHPSSPGGVFFLPHGTRIVQRLLNFVRTEYRRFGYHEVMTPMVFKRDLWEQSGHWQNYAEDIGSGERADWYGLKPMNCPAHCLLYASQPRTHHDLPLRLADFGSLHRWEAAGALSGLTRVRNFHQDDAHIFCRSDQVGDEIRATLAMIDRVYKGLRFSGYELHLATRPAEGYIGSLADWDDAERALKEALDGTGQPWQVKEGDGAFYGPKIDVMVRDALGRRHQTATVQLDFQLPQRFDLTYRDATSTACRPVIVHRAVLGSVERTMAILTEHFGGDWPLWLSPRQVMICPVAEKYVTYAQHVRQQLVDHHEDHGLPLFADVDTSGNTLGKMIRNAQQQRYNYILVVGEQEAADAAVNVRRLGTRESHTTKITDFALQLLKETRAMD